MSNSTEDLCFGRFAMSGEAHCTLAAKHATTLSMRINLPSNAIHCPRLRGYDGDDFVTVDANHLRLRSDSSTR